jgi:hypothetical protein
MLYRQYLLYERAKMLKCWFREGKRFVESSRCLMSCVRPGNVNQYDLGFILGFAQIYAKKKQIQILKTA